MSRFFISFVLFSYLATAHAQICKQVRSAFDVGSSETKVLAAEVDICKKTVNKSIFQKRIRVDFKGELLRQGNNTFSHDFLDKSVKSIVELKSELDKAVAKYCSKDDAECVADTRMTAVLTAAFREAGNAQEFVNLLRQEANIEAEVITQEREGFLGYLSGVIAVHGTIDFKSQTTPLVIDIGSGSMQWSYMDTNKRFQTFGLKFGSKSLVKFVVEDIRKRNIVDLTDKEIAALMNPLSETEVAKCAHFVDQQLQKIPAAYLEKARTSPVIGVGGVLGISAAKIVGVYDEKVAFDLHHKPFIVGHEPLTHNIMKFSKMSASQIGAIEKKYPESFVTNGILTREIVKKIGGKEIHANAIDLTVGEIFSRPDLFDPSK